MTGGLRCILLALLGVIGGLPIGFGLGHRSFEDRTRTLSDILALGEYETLASVQYKEADSPNARMALLDLLGFMDRMEANGRGEIQKAIDLDRGVTYMRLALLEERAGHNEQAREDISKAQKSMKRRDGRDTPESKLRQLVTKYDSTTQYELPGVFLLYREVSGTSTVRPSP